MNLRFRLLLHVHPWARSRSQRGFLFHGDFPARLAGRLSPLLPPSMSCGCKLDPQQHRQISTPYQTIQEAPCDFWQLAWSVCFHPSCQQIKSVSFRIDSKHMPNFQKTQARPWPAALTPSDGKYCRLCSTLLLWSVGSSAISPIHQHLTQQTHLPISLRNLRFKEVVQA